MVRRSRAARRASRNAWLMLVGSVLALAGIVSLLVYLYMTTDPAPDAVTLCPESGPLGHTVLLLDNTDPYSFIQKQQLKQNLRAMSSSYVPEGYLLSVFVLGADFTANAEPVFEKCNPGTGAGKSEWNHNPERMKKRFQEGFQDPLVKLSDAVLLDNPSERSPVFEMLQLAATNGFKRHNVNGPKKLLIYSDMLANTSEFSMFKGVPDYAAFKESPYGRQIGVSLNGVTVDINILFKYPKLQTIRLQAFWEAHFNASGASVDRSQPFGAQ